MGWIRQVVLEGLCKLNLAKATFVAFRWPQHIQEGLAPVTDGGGRLRGPGARADITLGSNFYRGHLQFVTRHREVGPIGLRLPGVELLARGDLE
jgi:hypothetical protein